jgi:hypothetical protein
VKKKEKKDNKEVKSKKDDKDKKPKEDKKNEKKAEDEEEDTEEVDLSARGCGSTMAFIPSEQDDANAFARIVKGTVRQKTFFGDMLSLSDGNFNRFFGSLGDDNQLALEAMRGRYQERRQGKKISLTQNQNNCALPFLVMSYFDYHLSFEFLFPLPFFVHFCS